MFLRDSLCQNKIFIVCFSLFLCCFCSLFLFSSSASAVDNRQIQYWVSSGESWAAFDEGLYGIDFSLTSQSHNDYPNTYGYFQVTPAQQAQGFQIKLENLRVWFYFPDLTGKQAASGVFHLVLYPNLADANWYCYQLGHITSSLRSSDDSASAQTSSPSCRVYYENNSAVIHLSTKFTVSPASGGAFSSNPYFYASFTNDVTNTPIIQNNSNYNPVYTGAYLYLHDNVVVDDINYSSDPNTGILNDISNQISDLDSGAQERWETEREEQDAKEQELEDQADDLSLSVPVTSNLFSSLFNTNYLSSCRTFTRIPALFDADSMRICPPYPSSLVNILTSVSSIFLFALVSRLYYKKLKGGVDG